MSSGAVRKKKSPGTRRRQQTVLIQRHTRRGLVCRQNVLIKVARSLGWKEVRQPGDSELIKEFDFAWYAGAADVFLDDFRDILGKQRVSRFPGIHDLLSKVALSKQIACLKQARPQSFAFYPKTFMLPEEREEAVAYLSSDPDMVVIVKPSEGRGGDGIYLTQDPARVRECDAPAILQRYVTPVYILDGYKFDIRLYALITSLDPPQAYIYREGMVRLATKPYQAPTPSNFDEVLMHLTNFSLNKASTAFVDKGGKQAAPKDDAGVVGEKSGSSCHHAGSKRTLTALLSHIESQFNSNLSTQCWESLRAIVEESLLEAIIPQLFVNTEWLFTKGEPDSDDDQTEQGAPPPSARNCFQLVGYDILLDQDLTPHLLEVNGNPSIATGATVDWEIKEPLVRDTLNLISHRGEQSGDDRPPLGNYEALTSIQQGVLASPAALSAFAKLAGTAGHDKLGEGVKVPTPTASYDQVNQMTGLQYTHDLTYTEFVHALIRLAETLTATDDDLADFLKPAVNEVRTRMALS